MDGWRAESEYDVIDTDRGTDLFMNHDTLNDIMIYY